MMSFGKLCLKYFVQNKHLYKISSTCSFCRKVARYSVSTRFFTTETQPQVEKESFASMFRKSAFVEMGNLQDVIVVGKIFQVQDDNFYVDFGGKFHCVCKISSRLIDDLDKEALYKRGSYVIVMLKDFELSARFLGAAQDTTLLEADGKIIGAADMKYKKMLFLNRKFSSANNTQQQNELEPYSNADEHFSHEQADAVADDSEPTQQVIQNFEKDENNS